MAAVAGRTYPAVQFEIDPDRVADFARAIGGDPADGVPPTFAAVYSLYATAPQLFADEDAAVDFARLLHAEQEFEWSRHPRAGETVTSRGDRRLRRGFRRPQPDPPRRGLRALGGPAGRDRARHAADGDRGDGGGRGGGRTGSPPAAVG